jgi:hypothetical protein
MTCARFVVQVPLPVALVQHISVTQVTCHAGHDGLHDPSIRNTAVDGDGQGARKIEGRKTFKA